MGYALYDATGYTSETCFKCGVQFCMTTAFYQRRLSDKDTFYCPNGHGQQYIGKTAVEKECDRLKQELALEQQRRESAERSRKWAEKQARGANVAAGMAKAKTRLVLDRVHSGVCPHCNRTFAQLAAHMKAKHKEVVPSRGRDERS